MVPRGKQLEGCSDCLLPAGVEGEHNQVPEPCPDLPTACCALEILTNPRHKALRLRWVSLHTLPLHLTIHSGAGDRGE